MHEHVVTALTKALGEMMGDVDTLQSQIDARKLDIDGAKRTLLFFDPNAQVGDVRAVRKRGKQTLKRGEASSSIIELLKTAPLTAEQITIKIADSRNIALGTDAYRAWENRVRTWLYTGKAKGRVEVKFSEGGEKLWCLVPPKPPP